MTTYKTSKLDQTDLVFGLWLEFISRSVLAELQASTFSGYNLYHLVNTRTDTQTDRF